jgi:hypothetical protein
MVTSCTSVALHNNCRHAQNTDIAVRSHVVRLWKNIFGGYHHSVVCLTTGPYSFPNRVRHRVWSSASSLNFQYYRVFLRSTSRCLRLLPRLLCNFYSSFCRSLKNVLGGSSDATGDQSSEPSFSLLYVGYSFLPDSVLHLFIFTRLASIKNFPDFLSISRSVEYSALHKAMLQDVALY